MPKHKTPKSLPLPPSDDQSEHSQTVFVEVVELEELTEDEQLLRLQLERKVERAFYEAGCGLRELKQKRLYRSTHKNFEEYCRERFNYSRDMAYLKISAATVYENIQQFLPTIGRQIQMPTNERQLRDLVKANFEPELQAAVWVKSVEEAGNKVPSGRIVKGIVERLMELPLSKANDFCQIGDVFILTKLESTERKYNGCWAIALQLNDFTVEVAVYDLTSCTTARNRVYCEFVKLKPLLYRL